MTTPIVTPYPNTEFERRLHRLQRQRDMALRGYERHRMSPELAEALRSEIRKALDADGKPFDVVVAQRVYDLAIAAKDMCVAATAGVGETIKTIANNGGPIESLGELEPDAPAVQAQASETFGARILRELMTTLKPQPTQDTSAPLVLVHALAEARRTGMTDVARELEVKLFGAELVGDKPIERVPMPRNFAASIIGTDVPAGSYEHGFADGKAGKGPVFKAGSDYNEGYLAGCAARPVEEPPVEITVPVPHRFEARTTDRFAGPPHETCEHCGRDPRNTIHTNKELFEVPEYSSNGVTL